MQDKEHEREVFGSLAKKDLYSEAPSEEYLNLYKKLLQDRYSHPGGALLLDLGCGTGNNSIRLAKLGFTVTGIDLSPTAVAVAGQKAREENVDIVFRVEDAEDLTFEPETFDVCFCGGVLHHFQHLERVAEELFRVMKKGGVVCSYDPNALHPYSFFSHNILNRWFHLHKYYQYFSENERALSPSDLRIAFEKAGFSEFSFTSVMLHSKKKSFQNIRNLAYSVCSMSLSEMKSGNMVIMRCRKM